MREEAKSVVVRLPAPDVWDYLADYDNVVRLGWEEASAQRMRPSFKCKVRYRVMTVWNGVRTFYKACMEEADRPHALTWSTREGLAKSWVRFELDPISDTTTRVLVTLHIEVASARSAEGVVWELLQPSFLRTVSHLEHLHHSVLATHGA